MRTKLRVALACMAGVCSWCAWAAVRMAPKPTWATEGATGSDGRSEERLSSGIIGSKHDFTESGAVARDLCLPCHTPHVAAENAALRSGRPARSRSGPSAGTKEISLDSASLLCLSCHDGVIASDVYGGAHAMVWSDRSASGATPGMMRLSSHPVGIRYPEGTAGYHGAGVVTQDGRLKLPEGRIQCTTCHDPHNTGRHAGMLNKSNARSALCLTCHDL